MIFVLQMPDHNETEVEELESRFNLASRSSEVQQAFIHFSLQNLEDAIKPVSACYHEKKLKNKVRPVDLFNVNNAQAKRAEWLGRRSEMV